MEQRRSQPHPLELEQWLLEEQTASERARTEAHLDEAERARLRDDDAVLRARLFASCPPNELARRVRERLVREASGTRRAHPSARRYVLGAAVVVACALLAVLRPPESSERAGAPVAEPGERAKGVGLELRVFRQHGSAVERLASGAQVAAHQVLQLGYARGGYSHGVLLSIDGRGGVTLHAPREPSESTALPARSEHLLSEAYELDDAPAFERFIFVGARQPLAVEQVLDAARALARDPGKGRSAPLVLSVANEQRSVLVLKSAQE